MSALRQVLADYLAVRRILGIIDVPGYASIFVGITFLAGIQLLFLGVIGEYVARIYRELKGVLLPHELEDLCGRSVVKRLIR